MKSIKTVEFLRRRVLAQYEHAEMKVGIVIEENENPVSVVKELTRFVKDALYETGEFASDLVTGKASVAAPKTEVAGTKVEKPKTETKTEVKTEAKVEESKKVEEAKKETAKQDEGTTSEAKPQDEKKEEKKADEKKTTTRKETTTKIKSTKATAYDRNLDVHKNLLGQYLDKQFPNWRKPDELKKAGTASRELQGSDFLDNDGQILESFKEAFSKYMV